MDATVTSLNTCVRERKGEGKNNGRTYPCNQSEPKRHGPNTKRKIVENHIFIAEM